MVKTQTLTRKEEMNNVKESYQDNPEAPVAYNMKWTKMC